MIIERVIDYDVLGEKVVLAKVREVRKSTKYPTKLMYICDLFDADGKALALDRYVYDDLFIPELRADERAYLAGKIPNDKWAANTIKLWFDDRQTKDEDGIMSKDDPYAYTAKDTKVQLLSRIKPIMEILK